MGINRKRNLAVSYGSIYTRYGVYRIIIKSKQTKWCMIFDSGQTTNNRHVLITVSDLN